MNLLAELKQRNVFRAAAAYAVVAWLLIQIADILLGNFGAPGWVFKSFIALLILGMPLVLCFAWAFELTPEGLKREEEIDRSRLLSRQIGRKLDFAIIAVLAVGLIYFAADKFVLAPQRVAEAQRQQVEQMAAAQEDRSIAVLPFVNMSDDAGNEYFSDGISEELLNLLAKIPELRVISRSSAFSFKGQSLEISEIARRLNVAHILEGSVRKAGNRVRITAQLIAAGSDAHLWSQTYDRTLDDIFAIQDEIATDVVKELKLKLLGAAPRTRATAPQAYEFYLQAKVLGRQRTAEALEQSVALYRKALAIDPRFAPAWNALAANFISETSVGLLSTAEGKSRAREAAEQALAIDPDYAPAHARLGFIAMAFDNDLAAAARHLERALALDPVTPEVLNSAATLLGNLGRSDAALALWEALVRRDPVDEAALFSLALNHLYAGRYDAAIAAFRTLLDFSPGFGGAHYNLGAAKLFAGDAPGALAEIEQETSEVWRMVGLPIAYQELGRKADADTALATLIVKYEKDAAYNIAYVHAFRGEADAAFQWLDKAVTYGDSGLAEIGRENLFSAIHDDPRWLPFLEKIGKSPAQLDAIEFNPTLPDEAPP